jgi:hypothetical protein
VLSGIDVAVSSDPKRTMPAVVFGRREKIRAAGPFISLLAEFERRLRAASRLAVIGYSFRDDHINEIIRRWINNGVEHRLFVLGRSLKTVSSFAPPDFWSRLQTPLSSGDRLFKVEGTTADRLSEFLGAVAGGSEPRANEVGGTSVPSE